MDSEWKMTKRRRKEERIFEKVSNKV